MNQRKAFLETLRLAAKNGMASAELPVNLDYEHLATMWSRSQDPSFSEAKLGRWLGWAQAAVVAAGCGTLEEMKAINQRHSGEDISQEEPQEPQPWELPDYPGEPEAHEPWAKVIWETSRADEGTISATGANIIAKALLAAIGRGELKFPTPELVVNGVPQDPSDPLSWKIGPGHIVEVPEGLKHPLMDVLERIAEAIENAGPDYDALQTMASALDSMERQRR